MLFVTHLVNGPSDMLRAAAVEFMGTGSATVAGDIAGPIPFSQAMAAATDEVRCADCDTFLIPTGSDQLVVCKPVLCLTWF